MNCEAISGYGEANMYTIYYKGMYIHGYISTNRVFWYRGNCRKESASLRGAKCSITRSINYRGIE